LLELTFSYTSPPLCQPFREFERLKLVEVKVDGRRYLVRTELEGKAYEAFRAVGMRVPGRSLRWGGYCGTRE